MLRPVETQSREIKKLDGLWSFCTDADDCGIAQQWWRQPLPQSRAIAVPGSYNDQFADAEIATMSAMSGISSTSASPKAGSINASFYVLMPSRIMERYG